jgi:hypothetical protein
MHGSAVGVQGLEAETLRRSEIQGLCRVFRRRPCMHGSAVGVQGLIAETLRRSEQPMRSTWAQVQGPEAETLQEFKAIDALVYQLYGLSEEEIAVAEGK